MSAIKSKKRKWLWAVFILAAAILALVYVRTQLQTKTQTTVDFTSFTVQNGAIEVSVTGTGSLAAEKTSTDMMLPAGVTPDEVLVEIQDTVKKGDTLATLDPALLLALIGTTQDELAMLDTRLAAAGGIKASQYIKTMIPGRVKQVFTADGDDISSVMAESGALMILSVDGKMSLSFVPETTTGLTAGNTVTVTLPNASREEGEIVSISPSLCVVTLDDDGPQEGDRAVVSLPDGTPLGSGSLMINRPLAVTFPSGIVEDVLKDVDDLVTKGASLIKLRESAAAGDYEQIYQDRLARADKLNALLKLSKTNALLSPADGTVTELYIADGQPAGAAAEDEMTAFVLETSTVMRLVVAVDEQDILKLAIGQPAAITLDALPSQLFSGTISEIADEGEAGPDVTTYDVTIDFDSNDTLKTGMHASASIITKRKDSIVVIPVEALQETDGEQYVYVGTAPDSQTLGEKRLVVTGISDGRLVEVTQGLQEGEQVNYAYSSGNVNTPGMMPFGGSRMRNITNPGATPTSGN